jgi:hypothetical protein
MLPSTLLSFCRWCTVSLAGAEPNFQHCVYCLTKKGSCRYVDTQMTLQKNVELPASGRSSKRKIQKLTAVREHNTLQQHVKRVYAVWHVQINFSTSQDLEMPYVSHSYVFVVFQMYLSLKCTVVTICTNCCNITKFDILPTVCTCALHMTPKNNPHPEQQ